MNALYITSKPIYPIIDGGCVASDSFLKCLLHAKINVKYLTLSTEKHPFDKTKIPNDLLKSTKPEEVYVDTKVSFWKAFLHLFKSGSYNVNRFYTSKMETLAINSVNDHNPDLIILDSLYSTPYLDCLRRNFKGKLFVRSHNVESEIWRDYANNEKNLLKRIYLRKLSRDLQKYEKKIIASIDGIITLSPDDLNYFSRFQPSLKGVTIPVSINIPDVNIHANSHDIFHIGTLNWKPNEQAVISLIGMLPKLLEINPRLKIRIAGADIERLNKFSNVENVELIGFVESPIKFGASSGILMSPILSGSGVRIKLLEMMSIGVPIITTTVGAQGLFKEGYDAIIVANSSQELIESYRQLYSNKDARKELSRKSIEYIKEFHNIVPISKKLVDFIRTT